MAMCTAVINCRLAEQCPTAAVVEEANPSNSRCCCNSLDNFQRALADSRILPLAVGTCVPKSGRDLDTPANFLGAEQNSNTTTRSESSDQPRSRQWTRRENHREDFQGIRCPSLIECLAARPSASFIVLTTSLSAIVTSRPSVLFAWVFGNNPPPSPTYRGPAHPPIHTAINLALPIRRPSLLQACVHNPAAVWSGQAAATQKSHWHFAHFPLFTNISRFSATDLPSSPTLCVCFSHPPLPPVLSSIHLISPSGTELPTPIARVFRFAPALSSLPRLFASQSADGFCLRSLPQCARHLQYPLTCPLDVSAEGFTES